MTRKASSPDKTQFIYVPRGADKGDCVVCSTGVLFRDQTVEETFGTKEGYRCDTCNTPFIEGYLTIDRRPWETRIPRRYFTKAALEDDFFAEEL